MFRQEAAASAKALRLHMLGVSQEYQGGQWGGGGGGGGRVYKGRIKGMRDREAWDVGPIGFLHFIPHPLVFILHVVRTSRGFYFCLMLSNFNSVQKPRWELALRGHRDAPLKVDL